MLAYRWLPDVNGTPKLVVRKLAGGEPQTFDVPNVTSARYFRWSSDGRSVIYADSSAGSSRLYAQPVAGGGPKLIAEFKDKRIYSFDISPRGAGIALALGNEMSEALLISNFK